MPQARSSRFPDFCSRRASRRESRFLVFCNWRVCLTPNRCAVLVECGARRTLRLKRSQKCDQIVDLVRFKHIFRHRFSTAIVDDDNSFGEGFGEITDVIAFMQYPERRRGWIRTRPFRLNGMAAGAILLRKNLAALDRRIIGSACRSSGERHAKRDSHRAKCATTTRNGLLRSHDRSLSSASKSVDSGNAYSEPRTTSSSSTMLAISWCCPRKSASWFPVGWQLRRATGLRNQGLIRSKRERNRARPTA